MVWPKQPLQRRDDPLASPDTLTGLMVASQAGDRDAYDRLLRRCDPLIRRIARATGVPPHHLDDAVQETLITLHNARQTYDPDRSFEAWLATIARRRSVDALRRLGRVGRQEIHEPVAVDTHEDGAPDAVAALERQDEAGILHEAVASLSPVQRDAVMRLAIGEQSLSEASAESGRSVGALKVNLHRAIKILRSRLLQGRDAGISPGKGGDHV